MRLKTWSTGTEYAVAYVMGPDKDKGTVYLKAKNNVYNYLPFFVYYASKISVLLTKIGHKPRQRQYLVIHLKNYLRQI